MRERRNRLPLPQLERLEPRALLVGFYDGPASIPIQVTLRGTVPGSAVVQPASPTPGQPETLKVAALGRIKPLGLTTVTGSLRIASGGAHGTLVLETAKGSATLSVVGPSAPLSSAAPASTTLGFVLTGRTVVPNTLFSYVPENGSGMVTLTLVPRPSIRPGLTLEFQPASDQ
jgi:hypothetical protein